MAAIQASSLFASPPSRGLLVVAQAGFMPPRLLVVPAGTLLPPGVHAAVSVAAAPGVFVVAPATSRVPPAALAALAGSGRRGATRCVLAGVGSEPGDTSAGGVFVLAPATSRVPPAALAGSGRRGATRCVLAGAGSEPGNTAAEDAQYHALLQAQGDLALGLLSDLAPPAAPHRVGKYDELKNDVLQLVAAAKAGEDDKLGCAVSVVRAAYAVIRVAYWSYPNEALPSLPHEQRFVSLCLGTDPREDSLPTADSLGELAPLLGFEMLASEVGEGDVGLVKGILTAVGVATSAVRTARYLYGCCGGQA